jgi:hypothetical protein
VASVHQKECERRVDREDRDLEANDRQQRRVVLTPFPFSRDQGGLRIVAPKPPHPKITTLEEWRVLGAPMRGDRQWSDSYSAKEEAKLWLPYARSLVGRATRSDLPTENRRSRRRRPGVARFSVAYVRLSVRSHGHFLRNQVVTPSR